jgi:hypothetical protein
MLDLGSFSDGVKRGGGGAVLASRGVSANENNFAHRVTQINFGDLTPYLTYGINRSRRP